MEVDCPTFDVDWPANEVVMFATEFDTLMSDVATLAIDDEFCDSD